MSQPVRRRAQRNDQNQRADTMGTNVYSEKDSKSMHNSLNGEFILYQLLISRMLDDEKPMMNTKDSLIEYFEPEEKPDKEAMSEYDKHYKDEKAIHWYTRETCIYRILNKALRTQNIDDIIPFRLLIKGLNKQLGEEHKLFVKQQSTSSIQVYRGQLISKDEVNRLKTSNGQLISMNSFLSTSTNRKKALEFATSRAPPNDELTTILLEITVDLNSVGKPYADIKRLSAFPEEEEILFMFGCMFRINSIVYDEDVKLWMGKFSLCSNNDPDVKKFQESIENQVKGQNQLITLGTYFIQMLKYNEAQEHFEKILACELTKDPVELAYCHHGLAQVNIKKADYNSAISNLEKALEYLLDTSSNSDHPLVSTCYNDLGLVYSHQDKVKLALHWFDKALSMSNDNRAVTYSYLGKLHFRNSDYHLALEQLEKSLQFQSKTENAVIASTHIEIGKVYAALNQKEKASASFDKATEYQLKDLPPDHPDLGDTYGALGLMYLEQDELERAHEFIDKAYQIQLKSLPNNHPDFAETFKSFGKYYLKKDDLEKALFYFEKALENQLKTLAKTHSAVIETYNLLGNLCWKMKNYDGAFKNFEQVLNSDLEKEHSGDKAISDAYRNLGDLFLDKGDLDTALTYYLKLLNNELISKLYEDFSLVSVYKTIAEIYYVKQIFDQSLIYYNCLRDCYSENKPVDQDKIDETYKYIGKVYLKQYPFQKTSLSYHENNKNSKKSRLMITENDFIGTAHFEGYHLEAANRYFEHHLQTLLKKYPENDGKLSKTYQILATIAFEQNNFKQSQRYFLKLLNNELERKPLNDPSIDFIYRAMASIYYRHNEYSKSLYYLYRVLDCQMNNTAIKPSAIDKTYASIGDIYLTKTCFQFDSNNLNQPRKRDFALGAVSQRTRMSYEDDIQFQRRHVGQALTYFERLFGKATRRHSSDDICTILGYITYEAQLYDRAVYFFRTLLNRQHNQNSQNNPSLGQTYVILGTIYANLSQVYPALEHFKAALTIYQRASTIDPSALDKIQQKIRNLYFPRS